MVSSRGWTLPLTARSAVRFPVHFCDFQYLRNCRIHPPLFCAFLGMNKRNMTQRSSSVHSPSTQPAVLRLLVTPTQLQVYTRNLPQTLCCLKHSSDRLLVFPADHLQPHVRRRIDQHALGLQSDCKLGVRSTALRSDFLLIDFCDFQRINVEITPLSCNFLGKS